MMNHDEAECHGVSIVDSWIRGPLVPPVFTPSSCNKHILTTDVGSGSPRGFWVFQQTRFPPTKNTVKRGLSDLRFGRQSVGSAISCISQSQAKP